MRKTIECFAVHQIINVKKIPQLMKLQNSLHNMLTHKYREKRTINFLGSMLKVIAGTMDHEDSDYNRKKLKSTQRKST